MFEPLLTLLDDCCWFRVLSDVEEFRELRKKSNVKNNNIQHYLLIIYQSGWHFIIQAERNYFVYRFVVSYL